MNRLELKSVTRIYSMGAQPVQALSGVTMQVADGEMLAIVGASGSGKSTLMNIMGLLDRPTLGEYYLSGIPVHDSSVNERALLRNRHIGFIFQSFFLLPKLTALQNVGLPLFYRGVNASAVKSRSRKMLEALGVGEYSQHKPAQLSGGQQQRVAIARALVGEPDIILADEPTGSLDSSTSQEMMNLLKLINHERGATIVIITHDDKVATQCSRIMMIRDGQINQTA